MTGSETPAQGRAVPVVLPSVEVVGLIFKASVREMLRRRILLFLALVCSLPLILVFIWRVFGVDHLDADVFFTNLVSSLYLQVLVYVVGLAFGIPAVHSEVQGRTLTYLFTRPIRKADIYTGRLLAVQVTAGGLLAASLVGCFMIMVVGNFDAFSIEFAKAYVNHVFIVLVATVCITGVSAIFGTVFRRPVVWGLLWAFGWELVISKFPGRLQNLTINFHVRNLMMDQQDIQATLMDAFRMLLTDDSQVSATASAFALLAFFAGATLVGGLLFSRKEYVIH